MTGTLMPVVIVAGVLVGVFSAMFGVGGGIIMVPFMVLGLELTQHTAEGTSLLVIVPTAFAAVLVHHKNGYVSIRTALMLGGGGVVGSYFGASLALRIDEDALTKGFAVFLILIGIRLSIQGLAKEKS